MKSYAEYIPIAGQLISLALNVLLAWAVWTIRQLAKEQIAAEREKTRAQFDRVDGDVTAIDRRVSKVEGRMDEAEDDIRALPTKADLARLEGEVKLVGAQVEGVSAGISRVEGYMMEHGVRGSR